MTDLPIVTVEFDFDAHRKFAVAQYKRFAITYEQLAEFAKRILKETLNPCLDAVIRAVENPLIFRGHNYE